MQHQNVLTIYHGSSKIIETPVFAQGKPNNDYGQGFYCTESIELAKEWACSTENDGYANCYQFDQTDLSILDLSSGGYHILNWFAILLENRTFRIGGEIASRAREYILEHFMLEYQSYDAIRGYRADDSYFSFANAFLNNTFSLQQLEKAMVLGALGEQIFLQSEKAFHQISFVDSTFAPKNIYLPKKLARDTQARETMRQEKETFHIENETYILDIIRGGWEDDDPRIQRVLFR